MSEGVRITKRTVDAAAAPRAGCRYLWDSGIPGFGLRLRDGRKVYLLKYSTGRRGKARWVTIGEHGKAWRPEEDGTPRVLTADLARDEALRLRGLIGDGKDPASARARARSMPTLAEFAPVYVRDHVTPHKASRSGAEDKRNLKRHVLRLLGGQRLDRIDNAEATRMHLALRETPVAANRCLSLLSHMLTMARQWKQLPEGWPNPCTDVRRFKETKRKRFLSHAELALAGVALASAEEMGTRARKDRPKGAVAADATSIAALRTLIFCGARASEVLELEHDQVDVEHGVALQKSKTGERPIYFSAPALAVIAAQPRLAGNPYVFPGHKPGSHLTVSGLDGVWERIRATCGLEDVRIHDLRHSFASVAAARGHALPIIGALLGHTRPDTTQRYAHLAADPLRDATKDVAEFIDQVMRSSVTAD